jgi:hypothetical protein
MNSPTAIAEDEEEDPKEFCMRQKPANYSDPVDAHIYLRHGGCQTTDEWIDLVIAAMDQAGFRARDQEEIRERLNELRPDYWSDVAGRNRT